MSLYSDFGTALYNFVGNIDISTASPSAGWAFSFNRLPKSDEMDEYPCYAVVPVRDTREVLDNVSDEVTMVYAVYIFVRFWDGNASESDSRELADLVSTALSRERRSPTLLAGVQTIGVAGEWGFDPDQVQRFYRIDVSARYIQELQP